MAPRGDLSESRFVTAAGVRVHYKEVGEGYPVICLHGAGPGANSESNFRRNVGALSERFRAVLVDMPQFGKSVLEAESPRISPLAEEAKVVNFGK